MRYGLTETDQPPFPKNVKLAIEMLDEPAIVVPPVADCPDCPECPDCPPACVWSCDGWIMNNAGVTSFVNYPSDFTSGVFTTTFSAGQRVMVTPVGQFCGHLVKLVVDDGTWSTHADNFFPSPSGTKPYATFEFRPLVFLSGSSHFGTVKAQINANDDGVTWTDMCGTIKIAAAGGG